MNFARGQRSIHKISLVQFSLSEACRFKRMKNEAALREEQAFLAAGDKKWG
jgi:hypothetical protein